MHKRLSAVLQELQPDAYTEPAQLHVAGWPNYAPLRLNLQTRAPDNGVQEFWNIVQLAGHELQPELQAQVGHCH